MSFTISKKYNEADPRKLADWQIADIAEETMPTVDRVAGQIGPYRRMKSSRWEGYANSIS